MEDQQLPEFDPERLSKVLPVSQAFVEVDSADLVVTAVKKHETRESLVVRVLNISEKSVSGAVRVNAPGFAAGDIYRISLEERRQEKLRWETADGFLWISWEGESSPWNLNGKNKRSGEGEFLEYENGRN